MNTLPYLKRVARPTALTLLVNSTYCPIRRQVPVRTLVSPVGESYVQGTVFVRIRNSRVPTLAKDAPSFLGVGSRDSSLGSAMSYGCVE